MNSMPGRKTYQVERQWRGTTKTCKKMQKYNQQKYQGNSRHARPEAPRIRQFCTCCTGASSKMSRIAWADSISLCTPKKEAQVLQTWRARTGDVFGWDESETLKHPSHLPHPSSKPAIVVGRIPCLCRNKSPIARTTTCSRDPLGHILKLPHELRMRMSMYIRKLAPRLKKCIKVLIAVRIWNVHFKCQAINYSKGGWTWSHYTARLQQLHTEIAEHQCLELETWEQNCSDGKEVFGNPGDCAGKPVDAYGWGEKWHLEAWVLRRSVIVGEKKDK